MADTPQHQPAAPARAATTTEVPPTLSPMASTDAMNAALAENQDSVLLFRDVSRLAGDGLPVDTVAEASKKALDAYKREREQADKAEEEIRAAQEEAAKEAEKAEAKN